MCELEEKCQLREEEFESYRRQLQSKPESRLQAEISMLSLEKVSYDCTRAHIFYGFTVTTCAHVPPATPCGSQRVRWRSPPEPPVISWLLTKGGRPTLLGVLVTVSGLLPCNSWTSTFCMGIKPVGDSNSAISLSGSSCISKECSRHVIIAVVRSV